MRSSTSTAQRAARAWARWRPVRLRHGGLGRGRREHRRHLADVLGGLAAVHQRRGRQLRQAGVSRRSRQTCCRRRPGCRHHRNRLDHGRPEGLAVRHERVPVLRDRARLGCSLVVRAALWRLRKEMPPHRAQRPRGLGVIGRIDVKQVGVSDDGVVELDVRLRRVGGRPTPLLEQTPRDVALSLPSTGAASIQRVSRSIRA